MRKLFIVTCDSSDPKRLRTVFKAMKGFGHRVDSIGRAAVPERQAPRIF